MKNKLLNCSIVIITKDRLEEITLLLKSIEIQSQLPKELIIVDDISSEIDGVKKDKWIHICKKLKSKGIIFKYLKVKYKNPSKSRNLGLKKATKKYIFFIDDDIVLLQNTLKLTLDAFKKNKQATAITPNFESVENLQKNIWSKYDMYYFNGAERVIKKTKEISFSPTAFFCVKNTFLKKNNIKFDSQYVDGEDHLFFGALLKNKGKLIYEPNITVLHHFRTTPLKLLKRRKQYAKGIVHIHQNKPNSYIKDWIPERKIQVLFFPVFVFLRAKELARNELKRLRISQRYFLPSFMDKIMIFFEIYQNKKTKSIALNQIREVLFRRF